MSRVKKLLEQLNNNAGSVNEAKINADSVDFDNIGGGFDVKVSRGASIYDDQLGIYLSGYSNNSATSAIFVNDEIGNDKEAYNKLIEIKEAIAKDLHDLANKFDEDIVKVFEKHGFKKKSSSL